MFIKKEKTIGIRSIKDSTTAWIGKQDHYYLKIIFSTKDISKFFVTKNGNKENQTCQRYDPFNQSQVDLKMKHYINQRNKSSNL